MSYIIRNSRGQLIVNLADGTINNTATSLTLVGRNIVRYGQDENENYVYLLENFANDNPPNNAILGQLWYNSATDVISAYNSANAWVALASQDYVQLQKISPVFTGVPQAPTAPTGTASNQIATTEFVTLSPSFSGVPTAPTAIYGSSTTQIATTAFVQGEKASPSFSGVPTAPTAAAGTNTVQIATTAFVQGEKASPTFTGIPVAPTAGAGTNTTQIATTEFVQGEKISPVFTGIPKAPTAAGGTSNTQIATTAFVSNAITVAQNTLSTMAFQNANSVAIIGGSITGITDLAVADGGTGASNAAAARINLGLGNIATQNIDNITITGGSITGITDLTINDGGTGASDAPTARINLGLGNIATQNINNVTITGGSITGITDLAVADGGTGASTAADARTNLGAAASSITITATGGLTGGGNLSNNFSISIASFSNGYGNRTVSGSPPTGGSNGDIWYQV